MLNLKVLVINVKTLILETPKFHYLKLRPIPPTVAVRSGAKDFSLCKRVPECSPANFRKKQFHQLGSQPQPKGST